MAENATKITKRGGYSGSAPTNEPKPPKTPGASTNPAPPGDEQAGSNESSTQTQDSSTSK